MTDPIFEIPLIIWAKGAAIATTVVVVGSLIKWACDQLEL